MPIDHNGVGYSEETREKIKTIHEVADWQYGIVRRIWSQRKAHKQPFYYHIDAYCGTGLNPEDCTESASLQFLRRLRKEPFQAEAALIDNGKDKHSGVPNIISIREMLTPTELAEVQLCEKCNQITIPRLLQGVGHQPLGMIFIDPNGVKDLPQLLPVIARVWQAGRMDLLLHVGTTAIKRARECKALPSYQWYLDDILKLTSKARGFIKRSPYQHGQGWFFILLTNAPKETFAQWAQKGWHDLDTPLGRYLRQVANYTQEERERLEAEQQPAQKALFE